MTKGSDLLDKIMGREVGKRLASQKKDLDELHRKLTIAEAGQVPGLIDEMFVLWTQQIDVEPKSDIRLVDPIYGEVVIEKELSEVFLQPLVQRLNYIRQLSFSYFDHPTAQHTRLSHSLGVARNTEVAVRGIFERGTKYSRQGKSKLDIKEAEIRQYVLEGKLAGLLHDLGHGPFAHVLDRLVGHLKIIGIKDVDKIYSADYIRTHLKKKIVDSGFDPDKIASIVGPKKVAAPVPGFMTLISDLVDSPLDTDRLDYLVRDAHTTGLQIGFVNPSNILARMVPYEADARDVQLAYDFSALPFIEHFFYARDVMYVNCYEEDRKSAAEEMLIAAAQDFIATDGIDIDKLMLLDDMSLIHLMLQLGTSSNLYYRMAKMLIARRIYVNAYEFYLSDIDKNRAQALKSSILSDLGVAYFGTSKNYAQTISNRHSTFRGEPWKLLVSFPSPNAFRQTEANVNVLLQDERTVRPAGEVSKILDKISEVIQQARMSIRIFVVPDATRSELEEVRKISKEVFETT